ncbi:inositol transporter 4-like [Quercus lobata]|nr:inositol transporter 4-like [Quercus lobata]
MAFSKTNWTLVGSLAFICAGLGLGSAAAPVLLSESAPKNIRGAVVCTSGLASTIGQWAPYLILLLSKKVNFSWRWTIGLSAVPTFIQLICMIFVQESPYTLAKQGKKGEVEKFLKRTFPAEKVQKEMDEIFQSSVEDCKKEEEQEVLTQSSFLKKIKTLVKQRQVWYLVGAAVMQLLQHFLGLTFVLHVSPKLSDKAGLSKPVKSLLPKFLDLLSSLFVILSVDFLGRRKLLITTLLLLFCDQLVLGFVLGRTENQSLAKFGVGAISIYLMAYTSGIGCLPILLSVEIVPYSYRGMASGMGSFSSWLGTLCTSRYTDFTVNKIGPSVFFIYSGVSVIVLFLVIFLIPEKVGTPLEKIDNSVGQTTKYQRLE